MQLLLAARLLLSAAELFWAFFFFDVADDVVSEGGRLLVLFALGAVPEPFGLAASTFVLCLFATVAVGWAADAAGFAVVAAGPLYSLALAELPWLGLLIAGL